MLGEAIDRRLEDAAATLGANRFYTMYWVMTGLHGLHVTLGILAVLTMYVLGRRGLFTPEYYAPVDVTALYWHFVDLVWMFVVPFVYLLNLAH